MISPDEIRAKAIRYWENQRVMRAELGEEILFPLLIPFAKLSTEVALKDFSRIREECIDLQKHSKEELGYGYTLEWKQVNTRRLGVQSFPTSIRFETAEDLCRFIGKETLLRRWRALVVEIGTAQPKLKSWIKNNPLRIIEQDGDWPRILSVISFFQANPKTRCYIRQLAIPNVDTKFIEQRLPLFRELLDLSLSPSSINDTSQSVAESQFERRYGLLLDEPLVRFRVLDSTIMGENGFHDLSIPISDFKRAQINCSHVFITENKSNGLSFPKCPGSIVVFGLGYGIHVIREIEWIKDKIVFYWGDIDTHGFSILSQLRSFLPTAKSLLMDRETLMESRSFWGQEPTGSRFHGKLDRLAPDENALFEDLSEDRIGVRVRLEQERIPFNHVCKRVADSLGSI